MKNKKTTFNINKSLWLFAISFLFSMIGLQAQNAILSLPPNYLDVIPNVIQPLPTQPLGSTNPATGYPNYNGQPADYTHHAMQDQNGDLLFFIVDYMIYDK
ncbi:MAG: hypothetical protein CVT95_12005, partial [Bacteroidetes bacterium HGW-Bacteroidetes-12]